MSGKHVAPRRTRLSKREREGLRLDSDEKTWREKLFRKYPELARNWDKARPTT